MTSQRSIALASLCMAACTAACVAQTYTTYSVVSSSDNINNTSSWNPTNIYAVDVNNDGIPDLIQDSASVSIQGDLGEFGVSIANGDGTFKPAVAYKYPAGVSLAPMAFGDFNGDGKIDIAVPVVGKSQLAVYLGNGDGTFKTPVLSTIALSSGQTFAASTLVAADFNHDGKVDLAVVGADQTTTTVYVLPGNGSGSYATATPILVEPTAGNASGSAVQSMAIGDFDSDSNADIAVDVTTGNNEGGYATATIYVLYGEGNFAFDQTTQYSGTGLPVSLGAGDLNSDGYTDLWAMDYYSYKLDTFYGRSTRALASYSYAMPQAAYSGGQYMPSLAMADFNDDGHMDLVTDVAENGKVYMQLFLGTANPGQFTPQTYNITTYGDVTYPTSPVAGDFNHDTKPDFAMVNSIAPGDTTIYTGVNGTSNGIWSDCAYPTSAAGVALCSPTTDPMNIINFNLSAHSFGALRKMELWVDGEKIAEQHNTWGGNAFFNFTGTFSQGQHQGTVYAADVDNTLHRVDFEFSLNPTDCEPTPESYGPVICSPTDGSTVSSPVLVEATSPVPGSLVRMEIWVDGVKRYTETNTIDLAAYITASPGTHDFRVYAISTDGTLYYQDATATVK